MDFDKLFQSQLDALKAEALDMFGGWLKAEASFVDSAFSGRVRFSPDAVTRKQGLSDLDSLLVTVCVGISNFIWLPVMGAVSDKIGRKPLLLAATILAIITAYPALSWLTANPSFSNLLMVELWLSFLYGSYNGAMVVSLTEIMPVEVRTTGFSLAYSLATATFGGFTPAARNCSSTGGGPISSVPTRIFGRRLRMPSDDNCR